MKKVLIISALAFFGCELTENTPNTKVNEIFTDYSLKAVFEESDSNWVLVAKNDGAFVVKKNKGEGTQDFRSYSGCQAVNDDACAVVTCPAESLNFRFCNVKTWGIDSLSFTYEGDTLKGRYFK